MAQRQIKTGNMATVIGIFEDQYFKKKPLTVVKPGTQSRRFTHIYDTIKFVMKLGKKKCVNITVFLTKKSYTILEVAKLFNTKIRYLKARPGERYASALTKMSLNNKIIRKYGKINLKDYVTSFIKAKIMKIKSSLKSIKKRDLNSKLVRRRGRVYVINKTNPKFKARQK